MVRNCPIVLPFLAIFSLVACNTQGVETNKPIESKILITPSENLGPTQRTFEFRCRTETIYGCINFMISYRTTISAQSIIMDFLAITQPQICLTALGPATATINLGSLSPGTYSLLISVNGEIIPAQLVVTTHSYEILNGESRWTGFTEPLLRRVPDQTIWGLVSYNGSPTRAQSFLDSLQSVGAQTRSLNSGYYGYFRIDTAGNIMPPSNDIQYGRQFDQWYNYWFGGDLTMPRNIVKFYGKTYSDSLDVRLYSWNGNAFYSWVLKNEP